MCHSVEMYMPRMVGAEAERRLADVPRPVRARRAGLCPALARLFAAVSRPLTAAFVSYKLRAERTGAGMRPAAQEEKA